MNSAVCSCVYVRFFASLMMLCWLTRETDHCSARTLVSKGERKGLCIMLDAKILVLVKDHLGPSPLYPLSMSYCTSAVHILPERYLSLGLQDMP